MENIKGNWYKYSTSSEVESKILNKHLTCSTNWQSSINDYYSTAYIFRNEDKEDKILITLDDKNSIYDIKGRGIDEIIEEEYIDILLDKLRKLNKIPADEFDMCERYLMELKKLYEIKNKKDLDVSDIKYLYLAKKRVEESLDYHKIPLFDEIIKERDIYSDYSKLDPKDKLKMIIKYGMFYPNELLKDKTMIIKAIKLLPALFKAVPSNIDGYYDIARQAIKSNVANLDYINPDYTYYNKLAVYAVSINPYALEFINEKSYSYVRNSKTIDFDTLKMNDEIDGIIKEIDKIIEEKRKLSIKLKKNNN